MTPKEISSTLKFLPCLFKDKKNVLLHVEAYPCYVNYVIDLS
uniref:Uncharacterized protein n=1 Tax=Setaria italica TaxID=4555 RepID=K3YNY6_SETIT